MATRKKKTRGPRSGAGLQRRAPGSRDLARKVARMMLDGEVGPRLDNQLASLARITREEAGTGSVAHVERLVWGLLLFAAYDLGAQGAARLIAGAGRKR